MERKLVRILGRKEIPGRPLIYATTKQFLELFNLKDLKDLPTPREIEALTDTK
jgi:segregation and condensation protein B